MPSDWRQEGRERLKELGEGNTLKLDEGENTVRVMPDKKDLLPDGRLGPKGIVSKPFREFGYHQDVGPDKLGLGCGIDSKGRGKCWLCQVKIPELEATGVSSKMAIADKIRRQDKLMIQASRVDPESKKFSTPKPWWSSLGTAASVGNRVFSRITSMRRDHVDPIKGHNLIIEATGSGMNRRYPNVDSDEDPMKVPTGVLALVKDLDSLVPKYDEEEQKRVYFGKPRRGEEETHSRPRQGQRREEPAPEDYEAGSEEQETTEEQYEEPLEETEEIVETEAEAEPEGDPDAEPQEYEAEAEPEGDPDAEPQEYDAEEEPVVEEEEPEPAPPPRRTAPPAKKTAPPAKRAAAPPPSKKSAPPAKKTVRR